MPNTFGRQSPLWTSGQFLQVTADGRPEWKSGGITIDWTTVAAVTSSPATIPVELTVVPIGNKYLRYGQVVTKITHAPAQTITVGGTPTGGTFTAVGVRPDTGVSATATIAYNASVANVQTAMDSIFGVGNTVVSGSGALPGNVMTVTFAGALLDYAVALMTGSAALLTGGTPTLTYAATVGGGDYGKFGPYDPSASDGRQTLTRGEAFILNSTVLQSGLVTGMPTGATDNPPALYGGAVYKDRLLQAGSGSHTLAAGPTLSELLTVFPRLVLVEN